MGTVVTRKRVASLCAALFALATLAVTAGHAASDSWRQISDRDGIRVFVREVEGQSMPWFRGVSVMDASVEKLTDILTDINNGCEWTARCMDTHIVRITGPASAIFYTRTDAPWPISDRDAVLLGKMRREGKIVVMTFEASTDHDVPIPEGVVRMTRLQGAYRLSPAGDNRTEVVFEVQADPGGWIPDWMARWAAKAIPTDTLKGLHNRIARDNEIAGK